MKKTLSLLLLLPGFACFAQKVNLALNLKKDSTYYLKNTSTMQIKQNVQGQQVDVGTTIGGSIAHKVLAVHDSVYSMEVTYVSMRMAMNMMGTSFEFSSDVKDNSPVSSTDMAAMMSKMLKAMTNKPFLMELSKTGHVLSIKNVDVMLNGMFSDLPQLPDEQKAQLKAQMEKSFGETSIKNSFQMAFPAFPKDKVGINDKWTSSGLVQSTMTARINTTYTLTQVTDIAYLVTGDGVITGDQNQGPATLNGMTAKFTDVTGKISTDFAFDKNTGWILSSKTKEAIKGNMNAQLPTGQSLTYPIEMSGEFSVVP